MVIRRDHLLPLLADCVRHGVALRSECTCGLPLALAGGASFKCACGLGWDSLPAVPLTEAERARDRTTLLAYETLFRHGNPRVMSRAIWMVQRREQSSVRWSPRNPDLTATTGRLHTSVATIVRLMLAAPIESSQYLVYVPERDRPRCLASLAGTWIPASVGTAMTKPSLPRFGETLRLF